MLSPPSSREISQTWRQPIVRCPTTSFPTAPEKLKDQFDRQKNKLEVEELNARHSYQSIMQQLADNVENAEHEVYKKKKEISSTAQEKAEAEGDLDQTVADHAEDQKYLD